MEKRWGKGTDSQYKSSKVEEQVGERVGQAVAWDKLAVGQRYGQWWGYIQVDNQSDSQMVMKI